MNLVKSTLELLERNADAIASAGLWPAVLWSALTLVAGTGLILIVRRWCRGTWRAVMTAVLALDLVLLAIPAVAASVAVPRSALHAAGLVADNAGDLGLVHSAGMVLLQPVLEAYTQNYTDEEALDRLEGRRGIDLTALTQEDVRETALSRLDEATIRRTLEKVRSEVPIPRTDVPPRLVALGIERGIDTLSASGDIFPDLLAALEPQDDQLPPDRAADQVGRRFFSKHSLTLTRRAMGTDPILLAIAGIGQFVLLAGLLGGLGAIITRTRETP